MRRNIRHPKLDHGRRRNPGRSFPTPMQNLPQATECSSAERWFGPAFAELHPLIQQLHRSGGELHGVVEIGFGSGIAGFFGRRIARRLGLPIAGTAQLRVRIEHVKTRMDWHRQFDAGPDFRSCFEPIGSYPDGYWQESSGRLQLQLGVDILQGGWCWRQRALRLWGMRVPNWLAPQTHAGKEIRAGDYCFHVAIQLPLLGRALSYSGRLKLASAAC